MELVFEAKEKKMKLKLYGKEYNVRVPKMSEGKLLQEKVTQAEPKDVIQVYCDFFLGLGVPQEALDSLDSIDFHELTSFILYPKKS